MAETLFDYSHGMNYHLNSTDIACPKVTRQHRAMKTTQDKSRKLSKLELLQEDYRSRLLHQKEQQLNALFEQKVKANLLPKQGSVREFFLNRRMLETKPGSNTAVTLPPLKSNSRYKGAARPNKKSRVDERRLVNDTEFKNVNQKSPKEYDLNQSGKTAENEDRSSSELVQLRKLRRRKSRQQLQNRVMQSYEKDLSSNAAAKYDRGRISRIDQGGEGYRIRRESRSSQARPSKMQSHKQDSRSDFASTYDRGRASRIDQKSRNRRSKIDEAHLLIKSQEQNSSSDFASSYDGGKMSRIDRKEGARYPKSQSNQIYKRTAKPSAGEETSNNCTAYGQIHQSSCNEQDLSKSLAKIKELSRRKTEEFLLRSMTAKATAKNQSPQPSPRRNFLDLDEMREMEIKLRETISRERKKLMFLQQRKKEAMGETVKDISKNVPTRNEKHLGSKTPKFSQSKHDEVDGVRKRTSPPKGQSTKQAPWSTRHDGQQQQRKELRSEKVNDLNSVSTTDLLTCSNCGRSFMRERISKHENACRKASARKKKPFDARRKRAEGTEMEKYFITGIEASDAPACEKKKANWRVKHENFIQTIRYAKGLDDKAPPPLTNPDYIECSYCRRKFKPSVAERHIPRCKDIKARPRPPRR